MTVSCRPRYLHRPISSTWFLHTRIQYNRFVQRERLEQIKLYDILTVLTKIFPLSMSTMATPFERVVKMESPHSDLILAGSDGSHPVNDIADSDWLSKSATICTRGVTDDSFSWGSYRRTAYRLSQTRQPSLTSIPISKNRHELATSRSVGITKIEQKLHHTYAVFSRSR
jgi:hypothetical protein